MQFKEGEKVFIKGLNKYAYIVEQISEVAYTVEIDDMEYSASIHDIQPLQEASSIPGKSMDKSKFEDFEEERVDILLEEKKEDGIVVRFDVYLKSFFSKPVHVECSTYLNRKGNIRIAKTLKSRELCFAFSISFADIELKPLFDIRLKDPNTLSIREEFQSALKTNQFLKEGSKIQGLSNLAHTLKLVKVAEHPANEISVNESKEKVIEKVVRKDRIEAKNAFNREIDLHADSIGINTKGKISSEIVIDQLEYAVSKLNEASDLEVDTLVFIHGIGNGTLRRKLHEYLDTMECLDYYKNEYSPKYGFGATEVWLKFNF